MSRGGRPCRLELLPQPLELLAAFRRQLAFLLELGLAGRGGLPKLPEVRLPCSHDLALRRQLGRPLVERRAQLLELLAPGLGRRAGGFELITQRLELAAARRRQPTLLLELPL